MTETKCEIVLKCIQIYGNVCKGEQGMKMSSNKVLRSRKVCQ